MYPAWKLKSCSLWHAGRKIKMSLGTQVGISLCCMPSLEVSWQNGKCTYIHREGWGIVTSVFLLFHHSKRSCLNLSCLLECTPSPPRPEPHRYQKENFLNVFICFCHVSRLWNPAKSWIDNRFNPRQDQQNYHLFFASNEIFFFFFILS